MPSAKGNIIIQAGHDSKFVATFLIDGIQYLYSGHVNPCQHPFSVNKATLKYNSIDDLTGTWTFTGQVGIFKVTFNIKNGTVATGPLPKNGQINPAWSVDGYGTWTTG
ncbi:hypothetical protein CVT25_015128 [Psilocybe cyanescens]|uniref:Uncharacterized protein n=1 Tax=Psilocybe cyanescens TaxID=93625 RepID=A0A409X260_PSICY|nr:hypothetical protein CVT25_015128 [Psilocybe cyanescens]